MENTDTDAENQHWNSDELEMKVRIILLWRSQKITQREGESPKLNRIVEETWQ